MLQFHEKIMVKPIKVNSVAISQENCQNLKFKNLSTFFLQDLIQKLDNAKRDLELAHNGMTSELHNHWAAEDEILTLQNALDESEIKVQDAKAEIQRLNKKIQDKVSVDHKLEQQFEQLSVNYINAQAELELKNENVAKLKAEILKKNAKIDANTKDLKVKKELEKKIEHLEKNKNKLKNDMEIKSEEISSLTLSVKTQQKLIQVRFELIYVFRAI